MNEAIKRFNLIDFLGILVPGVLVELCINHYWVDLLSPLENVFGNNTLSQCLCILGLGFLFGSGLHTLGSLLEQLLRKLLYKQQNNNNPCTDGQKNDGSTPAPDKTLSWDEFCQKNRSLQQEKRPERIVVFTAYTAMSRTLVAAFLTVLALLLIFDRGNGALILLCGIGIILFTIRWQHFEMLWVKEVFTLSESIQMSQTSMH